LPQKLSTANTAAAEKCNTLIQRGLFDRLAKCEQGAFPNTIDVVEKHGQNINWSVFRITNRRNGKYTPLKAKDKQEINWNANL